MGKRERGSRTPGAAGGRAELGLFQARGGGQEAWVLAHVLEGGREGKNRVTGSGG